MTLPTKKHADAGPSSASMWMKCPASVTLSRGKRRASSIYAREGTAAHTVAELAIKKEPIPDTITVEGDTFDVTDEMMEFVNVYVQYAEMLRETSDYFAVEQRVSLDYLFPNGMPEPVFGTADLLAYLTTDKALTVADLKYGKGYTVEAEGNPQARIYALGALGQLVVAGYEPPKTIHTIIIQPRGKGEPVKYETLTLTELVEWFRDELRPAIERIGAGDKTESPGDHCRWCPRAGECSALHSNAMAVAKAAFDEVSEAGLTNDELGAVLDRADLIEAWIKAVRAEASGRIDAGGAIPGWKLVAKRAHREWVDEAAARSELISAGFKPDQIDEEPRLLSPAKIEKVLKSSGMTKEGVALTIKPLVSQESSGTTLVREEDSRQAVDTSPRAVFDAIPAPDYF